MQNIGELSTYPHFSSSTTTIVRYRSRSRHDIRDEGWPFKNDSLILTRTQTGLQAVTYYTTKRYTSIVYTTIAYSHSRVLPGTVSTGAPSSFNGIVSDRNNSYTWVRFTPSPVVPLITPAMSTTRTTTTIKSTHFVTLTTTVTPSTVAKATTTSVTTPFSTPGPSAGFMGSAVPSDPHNHEPSFGQTNTKQPKNLIAEGPVPSHRAATVAGGITGAFAGLAIIALLAIFFIRRGRNRESDSTYSDDRRSKRHMSPRTRSLIPWHWDSGTPRQAGSVTTSGSTPQIPPFHSFSQAPAVFNDSGLIRISTDHWERPYSRDTADMRSYHPSLLPPPLRVTNPDRSARPSTSRAGSDGSMHDAGAADPNPSCRPGLLQKQKSAIGAALLAVKRTFSSDSISRIRTRDHSPNGLYAASAVQVNNPLAPPRLGQTLTMPSSVILAGGHMPNSSRSSFHNNIHHNNNNMNNTDDGKDRNNNKNDNALLKVPTRPLSTTSSSQESANIIFHKQPDDPFLTPSPPFIPLCNPATMPYSRFPSSGTIPRRPIPTPLQARVPSGQAQVVEEGHDRGSQNVIVGSGLSTDTTDSTVSISPTRMGSLQETPLEMLRSEVPFHNQAHGSITKTPEAGTGPQTREIGSGPGSGSGSGPGSSSGSGAGWTTSRTKSGGYLAPWSQYPTYPPPHSLSPSLSLSPSHQSQLYGIMRSRSRSRSISRRIQRSPSPVLYAGYSLHPDSRSDSRPLSQRSGSTGPFNLATASWVGGNAAGATGDGTASGAAGAADAVDARAGGAGASAGASAGDARANGRESASVSSISYIETDSGVVSGASSVVGSVDDRDSVCKDKDIKAYKGREETPNWTVVPYEGT